MGIHGMNRTVDYYNQHSKEYFEATRSTDMSDLYEAFLPYLHAGGKILDVGCGSGRDLKYFKEHGYEAEGVDASEELCRLASEYSGCKMTCCRIEDFTTEKRYDGIWCCASLLHLDDEALRQFFCKCAYWLTENGILFLSVKTGITDGPDGNGRWFRDFDEEKLTKLLEGSSKLSLERVFFTEDKGGRQGWKWMNVVINNSVIG